MGEYQHGFVKGRGTQTASRELIKKIREGYEVFEFDLRSFFNNVNAINVLRIVQADIPDLGT